MSNIKEIHYTICPVGNASYIAANRGRLKEGLQKHGVTPVLLQSLPQEYWVTHFTYQNDLLFREGGNIPPLWAKSNGAEVVLIGLALLKQKQYILTLADSAVDSIEQLRGHKIGIPTHPKAAIDFHKATAEHGFEIALAARGVPFSSVTWTELSDEGDFASDNDKQKRKFGWREVEALDDGEVDAIYVKLAQVQKLLSTGKYKVLFDIGAQPCLLAPINNEYPNALTVSRRVAEEAPHVVVEYVKQLLIAAQWAKTHLAETLELFGAQMYGTAGEVAGSHTFDFYRHITPNLSEESLTALEGQKRFLFDHGYLKQDFALEKWADGRFLKAAQAELAAEANNN